MKVYLVGSSDCEFTNTRYACLSKETAMKRWDEIRKDLIAENDACIETYTTDVMYNRIGKNLSETDPEKMDNYPHEEPFIQEMDTEE